MEKRVLTGMLLDMYGALLTPHSRELLSLYVEEDMSLQEIADSLSISRQAVHDSVNRAERQLYEYEEKLGFFEKEQSRARAVNELKQKLDEAGHALKSAAELINKLSDM